jgi:uncharacterized protein
MKYIVRDTRLDHKKKEILIVDGYNMIGAWPNLRKLREIDFDKSRDYLITQLAEYKAYTGMAIIVVFDAHFVNGIEKVDKNSKVEVIFTRKNQTADEKIEKLAIELRHVNHHIYVATSDFTEQWQIFGQGALRIPAMELYRSVTQNKKMISSRISEIPDQRLTISKTLNSKQTEILEKWRRGER